MTAVPPSVPAAPAPFRFVDTCPDCGYSLAGSPDEGVCPECGRAYDQRVLILHGAARGERANLSNAGWRSLPMAALGFLWFFMFAGRGWLEKGSVPGLLVLAAFGLSLVVQLAQRVGSRRPNLIRVYLSPAGCLQIDAFVPGPGVAVGWGFVYALLAAALLTGVPEWTRRSTPTDRVAAMVIVVIVIAAVAHHLIRRQIRAAAATPLEAIAPAEAIACAGRSWATLAEPSVGEEHSGRLRIQLRAKGRWWEPRPFAADADVACEAGRALIVRDLVREWWNAARQTPPANDDDNAGAPWSPVT